MPGITRIKTWIAKEVLVYSDLNNEFDNIINGLQASNLDGYSATVAQMRETTDPGDIGSESLALRISDELERIRFAINRIVGKTYWYEAPTRSLATTFLNASNYMTPNQSTDVSEIVSDFVSAGFIDDGNFSDAFFYGLGADKKFSDTSYSLRNPPLANRFFWVSPVSRIGNTGTISLWFKNMAPNDTIYLDVLAGLRVSLDVNGYIKLDQVVQTSPSNGTKTTHSITGTTPLSGSSTFNNVIIKWTYGPAATAKVELLVNNILIGMISAQDLIINKPATNAMSCLMGNRAFSTYTDALTNPGTNLPSAFGWTLSGSIVTPASNVVANGIHTINPGAVGTVYYGKAVFSSIPTNGVFFECKYRLRNAFVSVAAPQIGPHFGFYFRVGGVGGKGFHCRINGSTITFEQSTDITTVSGGTLLSIDHNSNDWTNIAVKVTSSTVTVYINGYKRGTFVTPNDTTAGNLFAFGKILSGNSYATFDVEYLYCGDAPNLDYITSNLTNNQYISDFCFIKTYLNDAASLASLQTTSPYLLFGRPDNSQAFASNTSWNPNASVSAGSTTYIGDVCKFVSDGRNPIKLNFKCNVRQAAATAGTYQFAAYLSINNISITGNNSTGPEFINQAGSASNAGISLMDAQVQIIPATNVPRLTFPMSVSYCEVIPAGFYTVSAYVTNFAGSPGAMTVETVKCNASV